jgi:ribosomal protein L40E
MNYCETWYVLMELPLSVMKDVSRLLCVPSSARSSKPASSCRCSYVKCTYKSFEQIISLQKKIKFLFKIR